MLNCDLVVAVRASRSLNRQQVARLEHALEGAIDDHQRDLLFLLDNYAERADPSWTPLLSRAATTLEDRPAAPPPPRPSLRLVHVA